MEGKQDKDLFNKKDHSSEFDAILVGAGPVGFVLAAQLLQYQPTFRLCLIERMHLDNIINAKNTDNRTTTLSAHTCDVFQKLGLWSSLKNQSVSIDAIVVDDQKKRASRLIFDTKDIGQPFGFTINNTFLRSQIALGLKKLSGLTILDGHAIDTIACKTDAQHVTLKNGVHIKAPLLIAADGRMSTIRQLFNVDFIRKPYYQNALVALLEHNIPHDNTAFETFLPQGPVAFLPYKNDSGESTTSALVLCHNSSFIERLITEPDTLHGLVKEYLPQKLGQLQKVYNTQTFPLEIGKAKKAFQSRLALIGDAAQYMHPVAGQGMNLGIRDALELANILAQAKRLGIDLGSYTLLSRYQRMRRSDVWPMLCLTHGLIKLSESRNPFISCLRQIGFGLVNNVPVAKKFFMYRAMGYKNSALG